MQRNLIGGGFAGDGLNGALVLLFKLLLSLQFGNVARLVGHFQRQRKFAIRNPGGAQVDRTGEFAFLDGLADRLPLAIAHFVIQLTGSHSRVILHPTADIDGWCLDLCAGVRAGDAPGGGFGVAIIGDILILRHALFAQLRVSAGL